MTITALTITTGLIFTTILLTSALKSKIKNKGLYVYLPFLISAVLCTLANVSKIPGNIQGIIQETIIVASTSIVTYETVIEKIENFLKNVNKAKNDDEHLGV